MTAHFLPRIWHGYQLNLRNLNHLHFNLQLRENPTFLLVTEQEILCCYTHDPLYFTKQLNNPFQHNYSSGSYSTSVGTLKQFTLINSYSWLNCFEPKPFIVISTARQYNSPVFNFCQGALKVNNQKYIDIQEKLSSAMNFTTRSLLLQLHLNATDLHNPYISLRYCDRQYISEHKKDKQNLWIWDIKIDKRTEYLVLKCKENEILCFTLKKK